jgi:hypothetical protein
VRVAGIPRRGNWQGNQIPARVSSSATSHERKGPSSSLLLLLLLLLVVRRAFALYFFSSLRNEIEIAETKNIRKKTTKEN